MVSEWTASLRTLCESVARWLLPSVITRPVRWTDPSRSPGSTSTAARVYFTGYFPPNEVTTMDLHMILANLRNFHLPAATLVASEAVFSNNSAMILETSDPAAALEVVALCEEMAFIAPRTLTVTSMASNATWEDKLEYMYAEDPSFFISKLRWRRSRNGARAIAQPAATQRQLQASQRAAASTPASSNSIADIMINGSLGHNGRQIELQVIKVLTDLGLGLQERASTTPSSAGTWHSLPQLGQVPRGDCRCIWPLRRSLRWFGTPCTTRPSSWGPTWSASRSQTTPPLPLRQKTAAGGPDAGRAPRAPQPRPAREFTLHGLNSPPWRLALHRLR